MNKKELQKLASAMGKASWKARKKNPKALEQLRTIASKGGKPVGKRRFKDCASRGSFLRSQLKNVSLPLRFQSPSQTTLSFHTPHPPVFPYTLSRNVMNQHQLSSCDPRRSAEVCKDIPVDLCRLGQRRKYHPGRSGNIEFWDLNREYL